MLASCLNLKHVTWVYGLRKPPELKRPEGRTPDPLFKISLGTIGTFRLTLFIV